MQGERENMKVVVRVRPLNRKENEAIQNYETFWQGRKRGRTKLAPAALSFYTKYHNVRPTEVIKLHANCISVCDQEYKNTDGKMRDYCFSEVFGEHFSNRDIFETCIKQDLEGIFEGINCTLLAYGITGSGKTFSVFGHPKVERGIGYLGFDYLFERRRELENQGAKVLMKFSFIEIYNENIRDLLSEDGRKLVSLGEEKGTVNLVDVMEVPIRSIEEIIHWVGLGVAKRTSAQTDSNLISSRSHAILKLSIETTRNGHRNTSKLYIIDLAGSEKLSIESSQRKNEGSNINRSLLTLGNCINALVDNNKKVGSCHVPYRDSKLTRLLKDSLGGSARTIMIACVSPYPFTLDESITTLNYAERAQGIRKDIVKNVKLVEHECQKCKDMLNFNSPQQMQQIVP